MKLHALMKMKNISARIGNLPAFGQSGRDVEMIIASQQIVEDQVVNPFRLRIEPTRDRDSSGCSR